MANLQSAYDTLMGTAAKRIADLEELFELFILLEGVEEFMQWVAERQCVLTLDELGNDTEGALVSDIMSVRRFTLPNVLKKSLDIFVSGKGTTNKQGTQQIDKLSVMGKELLEKWPSCDKTQVTEALESVNEIWENFNKDLMKFEKVIIRSIQLWSQF